MVAMKPKALSENERIRTLEKHGSTALEEQIDEHTGHPELVMEYHS
jgi:hypothetical protein